MYICINPHQFVVAPVEGIKARMQVNYNAGRRLTVRDCVKGVITKLGYHGLYRGWVPTALCRMSNYAYFGTCEAYKNEHPCVD